MHLKQSRSISSLDFLEMNAMKEKGIVVYREVDVVTIGNRNAVVVPYHVRSIFIEWP